MHFPVLFRREAVSTFAAGDAGPAEYLIDARMTRFSARKSPAGLRPRDGRKNSEMAVHVLRNSAVFKADLAIKRSNNAGVGEHGHQHL